MHGVRDSGSVGLINPFLPSLSLSLSQDGARALDGSSMAVYHRAHSL